TLDTIGPLARDVRSAAAALEMMTNCDGLVPNAVRSVDDFALAIPVSPWLRALDAQSRAVWQRISRGLPEIQLPDRARLTEVANTILFFEAFEHHRRWIDEHSSSYSPDVLASLRRGENISQSDYERAIAEQLLLRDQMEKAMDGVDAVLVPGSAIVSPPVTANSLEIREPLTCFTRPFNTTGQPVFCLPYPVDGLPVGIQVVGHFAADARLVEVASAIENAWRMTAANLNA
ncbi:MAG: amidase family protein, partial [Vulcanimicrobiaceae bacterium]